MRAFALAAVTLLAAATAGSSATAPPPRVTVVTDSVGAILSWDGDSHDALAAGLELRVEALTCRKLVVQGCYDKGVSPPSALETVQSLGRELGPVVVLDVGYNDVADGYADGLDRVMRALRDAGVQRVVWVTLVEFEPPWVAIDAQIRAAPSRWPRLVVADWAAVAAAHRDDWFLDHAHLNSTGGRAFAAFLRRYVLYACGPLCFPVVIQKERIETRVCARLARRKRRCV